MVTPVNDHKAVLDELYERMFRAFGPQHWWPAQTPFEVAVGAILTQNTSWSNVERAIMNLKRAHALSVRRVDGIPLETLAGLVRPSGYYNQKATRLKIFSRFLIDEYAGSLRRMAREDAAAARQRLLGIKGIGPETADSIMLYALEKPVFVIDAYTKRVLARHGIMDEHHSYGTFQRLFHEAYPAGGMRAHELVEFFNEYHALFVMTGKIYCRPSNPSCRECPLFMVADA